MAGLEEVARVAGVSTSTVSRAMSRPDMVAPGTLTRVRAAADEVGLRVNPAARALTTGRTGFFAMLVPDLRNPFYAAIIAGAQARAEQRGHWLIIAVTDSDREREVAALSELHDQVDGFVLLSPVGVARELVAAQRGKPAVAINRRVRGLTSFTVDTPGGLARILDRLAELGHRDVVYLAGPPGSWMDPRRQGELRRHADDLGVRLAVHGPARPAFAEGGEAAHRIAESACTAVLAFNSLLLLGLVFELGRLGVRVPEELSVAAADDMAFADLPGTPIAGVRVPARELGEVAVASLLTMVEGTTGRRPPSRTLPTHVLLEGSLLPPPS